MARAEHRNFESADEVRTFERGRLELVRMAGGVVGRLTLQPGWRWSDHVKPVARTELCEAPHFQYVISGALGARMADGTEFEVRAGDVNVLPPGHDGWVIGDEPAVVVDWGGAHVWGRAASE